MKAPEARLLTPRLAPSEQGARLVFIACSALAPGCMLLIMLFLFRAGLGLFMDSSEGPGISPGKFLFNTAWYPTYEPPDFGIGALVIASLAEDVIYIYSGHTVRHVHKYSLIQDEEVTGTARQALEEGTGRILEDWLALRVTGAKSPHAS